MDEESVSIIIPAKNEEHGLSQLLPEVRRIMPKAELIVVDDGSTDGTGSTATMHGARVIRHPYSIGNGGAVKTGARVAQGKFLVFLDADGQHPANSIPDLLAPLAAGYDMVVGARTAGSQAGIHRALANRFYNRLASWMVGKPIADLTSGFRAVRTEKFRRFLYLLPNGFSYPTTVTISFFRAGFPVRYVPVVAATRKGRSHIRPVRDGLRFLLIIFKIGTLYSPLRIFLPVSTAFFLLGIGHYLYTFLHSQRFTNMSALLLITSVVVFLIGLVSEQITALNYRDTER